MVAAMTIGCSGGAHLGALFIDVDGLCQAETLLRRGSTESAVRGTIARPLSPRSRRLGDHGCTVITADGANGAVSYHGLLNTEVTPAVDAALGLADRRVCRQIPVHLRLDRNAETGTNDAGRDVFDDRRGRGPARRCARSRTMIRMRVDNVLDWLPWNHISGSNVNFNGALWTGATFWIDGGKPTPALFGETIRNVLDCKPSTFGTAPIALAMLAEAMEEDEALLDAFFANMRSIGYGGATLSDDLYDRIQTLAIKATGRRIPIITMYGATETQGITVVHWEVERVGLIGLPLPGLTLKLVPTMGKLEVRVKGETVMPGYHNLPEKNR